MLDGSPYQGYLYAYPHKTAYRPLLPQPSLTDVWADERRDALFLYLHVPFCEMRCGFCNLFTRANPPAEQVTTYLRQLRREADAVRDAIPDASFALGAIGGGTPTYLTADELVELFAITATLGASVPWAVETSPATATADRLAVLAEHGTHRVSIGVQSFLDAEARAAGRPQRRSEVERALEALREARFPVLNIDLIYGIPGQTAATWAMSVEAALAWNPEELYLYPLYVRPLTGLHRHADDDGDWDAQRGSLYRQGRDRLREAGYVQLSMRQFRRHDAPTIVAEYSCQDDGMVGLGCGARSYTERLHYSFDYAVRVGAVRAVLEEYLRLRPADFASARVGIALDATERRRRWLVKSLLRAEGLDRTMWRERFGDEDSLLGNLEVLADRGWLLGDDQRLWLTDEGLAHSDVIGPWLVSPAVRELMTEYVAR